MKESEGIRHYRNELAQRLLQLRDGHRSVFASTILSVERQRAPYQTARVLRKTPEVLSKPVDGEKKSRTINGNERAHFRYYKSNEFYQGVVKDIQNLGGVGLAVGSDQGFDFMTIAKLEEVYMIDIDTHTHIISRGYLEIGSRLHKIFGRYPTVNEYLTLFDREYLPVTKSLLEVPSTTHTYAHDEITWLLDNIMWEHIGRYLEQKHAAYGKDSWIGTDANLRNIIAAYEQGKIHICKGSIVGELIPKIAKDLKKRRKQVSFIYVSNAPVREDESLRVWSLLPFAKQSRILFSCRERDYDFRGAPVSPNFEGGLGWSFVLFSPHDVSDWPKMKDKSEFSEVSTGCYRYKSKHKK